MTGSGYVSGGKPVVVAIVVHARLIRISDETEIPEVSRTAPIVAILLSKVAQVPLPEMGRLITAFSQELRQGDFIAWQMAKMVRRDKSEYAVPVGRPPG